MAAYNRLIVAGNLTRDPEIRYVDGGGKSVTQFDLAVNSRKDKEPLFLRIIAWENLGERCNEYLRKGSGALVEGRLEIRKYESKEGEKRLAVECVASTVQFLDGANRTSHGESSDEPPQAGNGKGTAGRQNSSGSQGANRSRTTTAPSHEEDEIPW